MKTFIYSLIAFIFFCCCGKTPSKQESKNLSADSAFSGTLVADTIIYDVIIKNPNPEDVWEAKKIQYLNHTALIDSLFELVYRKEIIAYDVFSNQPFSLSEVRSIEGQHDFDRNRIGKIQFTEKWYFDPLTKTLQKKTIAIALGYETYDESGDVRAYKPVFKVYLH